MNSKANTLSPHPSPLFYPTSPFPQQPSSAFNKKIKSTQKQFKIQQKTQKHHQKKTKNHSPTAPPPFLSLELLTKLQNYQKTQSGPLPWT
jgi:hypothetical protein